MLLTEAVLLDRDGTLVEDVPYNREPSLEAGAALAAGARAILVPTAATRRDEVEAAPAVVRDLEQAVALILGAAR